MDSLSDQQLLRDYAERRSESAFAELVRRHIDLVYSAALRMVRDAHLAEDVTQSAFVALAQNARQLSNHPVLSGWLHRTARNLAANVVRTDVRRREREQEVAAMNELLAAEPDAAWEKIALHLDAALDDLSELDRDAVLLRYFERKSAHDIAQTCGISDDAAQKRVSRAVERLRESFSKRGVAIGGSGLVVLISANAVQSAPLALATSISATAVLAGTTVHTSTAIAATKAIAMTAFQKTLVTATLAVVAGTGIYKAHQATQLREQVQALQQQQAPLAAQLDQLQQQHAEDSNQISSLTEEVAKANNNDLELLKLRGEVGFLRQQLSRPSAMQQQSKSKPAENPGAPDVPAQLASAIAQGDPTALQRLNDFAKSRSEFYRTNSVGLKGDQQSAVWSEAYGGILAAVDSLSEEAVKGNANAIQAIKQAVHMSSLQGAALIGLGKLAGAGDENALQILLNPERNGLLLSSVVDALGPSADNGNPKAIAALAMVLADESKKPLWFMASTALQKAAADGNPAAIEALKSFPPAQ